MFPQGDVVDKMYSMWHKLLIHFAFCFQRAQLLGHNRSGTLLREVCSVTTSENVCLEDILKVVKLWNTGLHQPCP